MKRLVREYFIVILLVILLVFSLQFMIWPKEDEFEDQLRDQRFEGHQAMLVASAGDAFQIRRDFIAQSKSSILLSTYRLHDDVYTKYLMDDLYRAAERGVEVKVLVDYRFGGVKDRGFINHPNIKMYAYNPLKVSNLRGFQSVHHEKYMVFDDSYTLLGGRNAGERFFADDGIYDLDVLVKGEAIARKAREHFERHIAFKSQIKEIVGRGEYKLQDESLHNPKSISFYDDQMVMVDQVSFLTNDINTKKRKGYLFSVFKDLALNSEKKYLVSPYSTKSKHLLGLFDEETILQTNSITSSPNYPAFSNYYRNRKHYLDAGMDIYEFQDEVLSIHTKAYLFDDHLFVGSMNLDHRSFNINTEAMFLIESKELSDKFKLLVSDYEQASVLYSGDRVEFEERKIQPSFIKVVLMRISSLFSRLLAPFV